MELILDLIQTAALVYLVDRQYRQKLPTIREYVQAAPAVVAVRAGREKVRQFLAAKAARRS